ncbi:MAG: response regulator [Geobacteraceae bacterium]|nr:response regulator [Geobacteraceae bacterium]
MNISDNYRDSGFSQQILNSTAEAVICIDLSGRCSIINSGCLSMLGYTDEASLLGKKIDDFIYSAASRGDASACSIMATVQKSGEYTSTFEQLIRSDGVLVTVSGRGCPLYFDDGVLAGAVVTFVDITAQKILEEQLRKAQKMEAIGTLAGGVAHDFNNILTAIIGFGTLMEMKMAPDDPLMKSLQQILSAADRASDLTRSILAFSRKQLTDMRCVSMNGIVQGIEKMMRRLLRENITLSVSLCKGDTPLLADAGQVEQVLLNLAANAADAMPKGGEIKVSTSRCIIDDEFAKKSGLPGAGSYLMLSFSDSGCGMDEATAMRIFDPFFSTKPEGEGTGLGLPVCYGIIRKHNGHIECQTEKGEGTSFRIYLPELSPVSFTQQAGLSSMDCLKGGETLLLAEDDQTVRALNKKMFEQLGYRVIEASDGEEALERYMQSRHSVALTILDVIMPKKGAAEVYRGIRLVDADAPVLFISGYSEDFLKKQDLPPEVQLIKKPVPPTRFLEIVRTELDRRSEKN